MGTISVFESVTLDGVMQGVGRKDEDTRGGFSHGAWGDGYADEVIGQFAGSSIVRSADPPGRMPRRWHSARTWPPAPSSNDAQRGRRRAEPG
jgi:hypothetical protein